MDKTVRLWHISRRECLCCFQHIDFVTALAFHPKNDQFFLSGSLDGKLRLWNIPEKKVTLWNEVDGNCKIITAANFIQVTMMSGWVLGLGRVGLGWFFPLVTRLLVIGLAGMAPMQ